MLVSAPAVSVRLLLRLYRSGADLATLAYEACEVDGIFGSSVANDRGWGAPSLGMLGGKFVKGAEEEGLGLLDVLAESCCIVGKFGEEEALVS